MQLHTYYEHENYEKKWWKYIPKSQFKNKKKTNHKLKYNNTKLTNKSAKNLYYDKIWKYQPKKGINITKNIVLCNHTICYLQQYFIIFTTTNQFFVLLLLFQLWCHYYIICLSILINFLGFSSKNMPLCSTCKIGYNLITSCDVPIHFM
jgi:hypothetical protein